MGNEKFWSVLKQIYKECGAWNENYESLLDELRIASELFATAVFLFQKTKRRDYLKM